MIAVWTTPNRNRAAGCFWMCLNSYRRRFWSLALSSLAAFTPSLCAWTPPPSSFRLSSSVVRPSIQQSGSAGLFPSSRTSRRGNDLAFWTSRIRGGESLPSRVFYSTTTETTSVAVNSTDSTMDEAGSPGDTTQGPGTMSAGEKLQQLRHRMKESNLDVYIVPTDDPHLSEYVPGAYMRRAFLTGFQGSAGTAVVTCSKKEDGAEQALLWTDSRYWNEAALQLDEKYWTLQKAGLPTTLTITKWIAQQAVAHYQETQTPLQIGFDPYVHSASFVQDLKTSLEEAAKEKDLRAPSTDEADANGGKDAVPEIGVFHTDLENLVDPVWGDARPAIPSSPFRVHPLEYAGKSVAEKVQQIVAEMATKKATLAVFCTLDDVAYLLNLRCQGDIPTCPVGIAYATIQRKKKQQQEAAASGEENKPEDDFVVTLYCDERKLRDASVQQHLENLVVVKPYDDIVGDIQAHCSPSTPESDYPPKVWLDSSRSNYALTRAVPPACLLNAQTAVTPMKACKNDAELDGMRRAHAVDGAAMAHFMAWLEDTIVAQGKTVSEVEIDEKLTSCRAQQEGFVEVSFPTIAGVGSNAAIVHYRAQADSPLLRHLDDKTPILIDSGGQYRYGTTDVTRTWYLGSDLEALPSDFCDCYTRVLKGNIGIDQMIFPESTPGFCLDVLARQHLWQVELDYGHGTGHGVGAALNVHEGPHSISPRWKNQEVLKKGMIVSNEPGYYADGHYGIRIENLLEIQHLHPETPADEANGQGETTVPAPKKKKFLKFDQLTLIPIQQNLIRTELMTDAELDWLDRYHQKVWERISPLLEPDTPAWKWLEKSVQPIWRKR